MNRDSLASLPGLFTRMRQVYPGAMDEQGFAGKFAWSVNKNAPGISWRYMGNV